MLRLQSETRARAYAARGAGSLVHGFRVDFLDFLHGYDVAGVAPGAADEGEDVRDLLVGQHHRRHHAVEFLAIHDDLGAAGTDL